MSDNSEQRLHNVFFYGLYMDPDLLQQRGVEARNPKRAEAPDYQLRIGNKATLLRAKGQKAYGMVYALTHKEIDSLYWGAGLTEYAAEAIMVEAGDETIAALCCNLILPPADHESNPDYEGKLAAVMQALGLPDLASYWGAA